MKNCLNCSEVLVGTKDKKFCNEYCKSAYHYKQIQKNEDVFYMKVDGHLKLNRRLFKAYNRAGISKVRKYVLLEKGR